jgi:phosphatidylserine/phosphatidylglycerophosphate/cardiolipin synthase-like enzyme
MLSIRLTLLMSVDGSCDRSAHSWDPIACFSTQKMNFEISECAYPKRDKCHVVPLVDGDRFYEAVEQAVDCAKRYVYVAISFVHMDFALPSGRNWLRLLNEAARRDVSVRLLFWQAVGNNPLFSNSCSTETDRVQLHRRIVSGIQARFDRSLHAHHCVHEKTWIVDDVAFTGGAILSNAWLGSHAATGSRHDICVQVRGMAALDVAHSFVHRWNSALELAPLVNTEQLLRPNASNDVHDDGDDEDENDDDDCGGSAFVQVTRNLSPDSLATHAVPPPLGTAGQRRFLVEAGERSIWQSYERALTLVDRTLYVENQHIAHAPMLRLIERALERGVRVAFVVPGFLAADHLHAMSARQRRCLLWLSRRACGRVLVSAVDRLHRLLLPAHFHTGRGRSPYAPAFLDALPRLDRYARDGRFVLAGLATPRLRSIYCHAKLCIADDVWYTIGSANAVDLSFDAQHTELNVSVWHAASAKSLRRELFAEHVGAAASSDDDSFDRFSDIAEQNRERIAQSLAPLSGTQAYAMTPSQYGFFVFCISMALEAQANRASLSKALFAIVGTLVALTALIIVTIVLLLIYI